MDVGWTYCSHQGMRACVYAPPGFEVPRAMTLDTAGGPVEFMLLADRVLECRPVEGATGRCDSYECHRRVLGKCQCGRHGSVRMERAA